MHKRKRGVLGKLPKYFAEERIGDEHVLMKIRRFIGRN